MTILSMITTVTGKNQITFSIYSCRPRDPSTGCLQENWSHLQHLVVALLPTTEEKMLPS